MTTTPPDAPAEPSDSGPRATPEEMRDLGRLRRSTTDRKIAGVAGGLGRHLDIDPVILRVAFVVLAFFGGAGLILYAAAWALVPEDDRERAAVDLDERSRTVALIALGVIAALALVGDTWSGGGWFPWPLVVLAVVVGLVWLGIGNRRSDRTTTVPAAPGEPLPPATYAAPAPRNPRRRGPVLFWFTLALIAFALGVLGIVDQAGVAVADSAYPALALGVVAVMLLVGSVMGRAGGLILLGLIGSVVLVAGTAADRFDGERVVYEPASGAAVEDTYTMSNGQLVLDLTNVDADELDGRTIELTGDAGEILVRVPDRTNVVTRVDIDGPGGYDLYDSRFTGGGFGTNTVRTWRSAATDPSFTLVTDLAVGQVSVEVE